MRWPRGTWKGIVRYQHEYYLPHRDDCIRGELEQGLEDERCVFFKGADDMSRQLVPELLLFPKLML